MTYNQLQLHLHLRAEQVHRQYSLHMAFLDCEQTDLPNPITLFPGLNKMDL